MAWVFELTDGAETVNLHDSSAVPEDERAFSVEPDGFSAPTPSARMTMAGTGNPFRSGSRLVSQSFTNRNVSLSLQVRGATRDALASNIQRVETMLRRAREFSQWGVGAQVQLKYQWDNASTPVYFNVITGSFDVIGPGSHSTFLAQGNLLRNCKLNLLCEPFAVAAEETIENYARNASFEFEGTELADWNQFIDGAHTATTERSTTRAYQGEASLRINVTDSSGAQESYRMQNTPAASFAEDDRCSVRVRCYIASRVTASARLLVRFEDSGGSPVGGSQTASTTTEGGWVTLEVEGMTAGATTDHVEVRLQAATTGGGQSIDVYFDSVLIVKAATLPKGWASGREVFNHFTDDGQVHINYLDLDDVPGDVPALLQVKATENEAHTKFWLGARHAERVNDQGLWREGEQFLDSEGGPLPESADAASSDGNYTAVGLHVEFDNAESIVDSKTIAGFDVDTAKPNRLGLVAVRTLIGPATHNGVSWNGEAMTLHATATGGGHRMTLWYIANPTDGDIVCSNTDSAVNSGMVAAAYHNVELSSPLGTAATLADDDVLGPAVEVTTHAGELVFGAVGVSVGSSIVPGGGETERTSQELTVTPSLQAQDERAASASTNIAWSLGTSPNFVTAIGVPIRPARMDSPLLIVDSIPTPPVGTYRVLARVNEQGTSPDVRLGIGYAYGDITVTPSVTAEYQAVEGSTFHVLDLGTLTLPPIAVPHGATAGDFTIRLAAYSAEASNYDDSIRLDWLMLLPVDFGSAYVSKDSGADVVLVDGRSELRAIALLNGNNVISYPASQGGDPPTAHPEGTRLYFAGDNGTGADIDDGWTVSVTYLPRFLSVAGA